VPFSEYESSARVETDLVLGPTPPGVPPSITDLYLTPVKADAVRDTVERAPDAPPASVAPAPPRPIARVVEVRRPWSPIAWIAIGAAAVGLAALAYLAIRYL
jgi:hypothetical protein